MRALCMLTLLSACVAISSAKATSRAQDEEEFIGYLFVHFTGEGYPNGEQVYFSLSVGNDPLNYRQLNGGQPVLSSNVGERGIRDPFIIRGADGNFRIIATDLKIYGNGDWDGAQRRGSKSIVVWESDDLVNWSTERLARVSPDICGNTWAPKVTYDDDLGVYVVYWASKLYPEDDPDHTTNSYNRMMFSVTPDFKTFGDAQVWTEKGYSVIDSAVIKQNGTYYRYTKDERGFGDNPCGKFITSDTSTVLTSTDWQFQAECLGSGDINQGEGPLIFKSNVDDSKWYLFIDEYGGRGYIPFETNDLASGVWTLPSEPFSFDGRPRHGSILPVTAREYERLLIAFSKDTTIRVS